MIVVCDASPIIALAAVGRLELLRDLYVDVVIPRAVQAEIVVGAGGPEIIAGAPWLVPRDARDGAMVAELQVQVDRGEAEAIALGIELGGISSSSMIARAGSSQSAVAFQSSG